MWKWPKIAGGLERGMAAGALLALLGCRPHGASHKSALQGVHEPAAAKLTFNRDIEPILSENCYACHGPDPGSRKAGLRLDRREFATAPHEKSGPAILAGDPDHSPLVARIRSTDAKRIMPPLEAHKTLNSVQIATLRRWVGEGADYQEHWSFIPPTRPPEPAVRRQDWAQTPIDRFILARLEHEGLEPSPEADPDSLIRRVTYDLTGLPPTPDEVAAFERDHSPAAYEQLVDRLLASPRYGEHRAHYWLDAVRYSDTHGLHNDNYRSVWPYRDYVIRSFNQNKPFDAFAREQLAGDLLPATGVDQLVASAFVRLGVSTSEGGSILEELRVNNQRERTEAFGAVFLGLTTGCAVCHDHKFDPTTQKDFYRLTAFFNNLTESPSDGGKADWAPSILVPKAENREAYDAVLARRAAIQGQIDARHRQAAALIQAWLATGTVRPQPVATEGLALRLRLDEGRGSALTNSAPGADPKIIAATGAAPIWGEYTWQWPVLRMDVETRIELAHIGDLEKDEAFSVGCWFMPRNQSIEDRVPLGAIAARMKAGQGWELFDHNGKVSLRLVHALPKDLIAVETKEKVLAYHRLNHIFATYDGSGRAAGVRIYVDGKAVEVVATDDALSGSIRTAAALQLGREEPDDHPLRESTYQDFRFYRRALSAAEVARVLSEDHAAEVIRRAPADWSEDEFKAVSDFYFARCDDPARDLAARLVPLDAELERLAAGGVPCLTCREDSRLAYADILVRGVYTDRAERVRPGVPHFLPQPPAGAPLNRLTLADWVVSAGNPLTARVTVNRMWAEIFGAGLVETPENFGLMGARPSHPELLDWLAVDFREHGWDLKRVYRQIVLSATYRQSVRISPALLEKDPHNRLLARGPRFRMDAEMLRDTALAAGGLLREKVGGPSTRPYQPTGVWESGSILGSNTRTYVMDHGDDLHRRSLYTFWKRIVIMPNMDALDAPSRDTSCTRRNRSDTPLQALVTMNDPQWLEAARGLGERLVLEANTNGDRLDRLGRLLLARPWLPDEKAILAQVLATYRAAYADRPEAARQLLGVGEAPLNPGVPPTELAPWMLVASTALNLDAVLNK